MTRVKILITIIAIVLAHTSLHAQGSPNVTLLDHIDDYPSVGYNDCWGYTAPDGREYALLGVRNGTSIVDITDAGNASEVDFISGPATCTWYDLKTYENYLYVVNDCFGGMQIIDLSDLPNSAELVTTYNGFSSSHNISIDIPNAMLYVEGSGVRALSLANPEEPVQVSTFGRSTHDIYAQNNIVYTSEGSFGTVGIFDLSVPASPTMLGRFSIPNSGYVHNAWATEDGNFLMTTEETTGKTVKLFDIRNLNNVPITSEYIGSSNLAHNAHIKGDFAYISHYGDGLVILDISDPFNMFEAGFYDTSPSTGGFNGAWGAFPFFPSGKILISDIQRGLFVFNFDESQPSVVSLNLTPDSPPVTIPPQGGQFSFDVELNNNSEAAQNVSFWTFVTLPNGAKTDPLFGPVPVDLAPGQTITANLTQNVPAVDPGSFTLHAKAGVFPNRVMAQDSFPFTVTSSPQLTQVSQTGATGWQVTENTKEGETLVQSVPDDFALGQNYPNPFNPTTTISYQLPQAERVKITVYDLTGRLVRELVNENQTAGAHTVQWNGIDRNGRPAASGLYLYRIRAGEFVQTRKMALVK